MKLLQHEEVDQVSGGLTPDQGAALELAVAGVAVVCSGGLLALAAIAAAGVCYELGD